MKRVNLSLFLTFIFFFPNSWAIENKLPLVNTVFDSFFILNSLNENDDIVKKGLAPYKIDFDTDEERRAHFEVVDCLNEVYRYGNLKESYCGGLNVGEKVNVKTVNYNNISQTYYSLNRVSTEDFEFGVNPYFYKTTKNDFQFTRTQELQKRFELMMTRCFENVGYLRVAKYSRIKFKIDKDAPPVAIKAIANDPTKSINVVTYKEFTSCDTIIHEVLHLAGLVDEYHNPLFPYRIVSKETNIMKNSEQSLMDAKGYLILKRCIKTEEDKGTGKIKCTKTKGDEIKWLRSEVILPVGHFFESSYKGDPEILGLVVTKDIEKDEVLPIRQDQLNFILKPGCAFGNYRYNVCSSLSWLNEKQFSEDKIPDICREDYDKSQEYIKSLKGK